jgi:hypothetical protein
VKIKETRLKSGAKSGTRGGKLLKIRLMVEESLQVEKPERRKVGEIGTLPPRSKCVKAAAKGLTAETYGKATTYLTHKTVCGMI